MEKLVMEKNKRRVFPLLLVCLVSALLFGLASYQSGDHYQKSIESLLRAKRQSESDPINVGDWLRNRIEATKIDAYLRHVTKVPPLAGTEEDWIRAKWIQDQWTESGLDSVRIIPYNVLLSYPDPEQPNKIYLLNENGSVQFETAGQQKPLQAAEEFTANVVNNFIAYSANGTVEGDLVYVHYGRTEDFETLESMGINVTGRIVMARYGKVFRGSIVRNAEKRGAIGVILFSDPQDYATRGRDQVYPKNIDLPGMAVQSGSSVIHRGDPLTPGFPATESAFRLDPSEVNLPRIVVQPIGYDEAEVLIRSLAATSLLPDNWQGGLNVSYQTGPGFREPGWKIRMQVRTTNQRATIHNVIGVIEGAVEPDRYVIVGSHSDAWAFGAVDCGSGMATLMELVRVTGDLKRIHDWRPRRTIIFGAWAAEEYGLIGSIEWVDQFKKIIDQRAVVYINTDPGVIVNELFIPRSVPSLHKVLRQVAQTVPNSIDEEVALGRTTLYDTWRHYMPDPAQPSQAFVRGVGSGSDFHGFIYFVGVSSADFSYRYRNASVGGYPLYHTMHDTYYAVTTFGDPGLKAHVALAQFRAEFMRLMADSLVLPFDLENYARFVSKGFHDFADKYAPLFEQHHISTAYFETSIDKLINSTTEFSQSLESIDNNNPYAVRRANDQLMYFERFFIEPKGLPLIPNADHVFLSPNPTNTYAALHFAPLVNLAESLFDAAGNTQEEQKWKTAIEQHLSALTWMTEQAAASLQADFLL